MTPAHRRYLATEAAAAAIINAVLSLAFVLVVFGGRSAIQVWGRGGLIVDAVPQSFMVALMSCLVPTVLTRRRRAAGVVAPLAPRIAPPRPLAVRALLVAAVATLCSVLLQVWLLPLAGPVWLFTAVLVFKCGYGGLLGAIVACVAVRIALAE